jgi:superfamily II DNA/RNA helicase
MANINNDDQNYTPHFDKQDDIDVENDESKHEFVNHSYRKYQPRHSNIGGSNHNGFDQSRERRSGNAPNRQGFEQSSERRSDGRTAARGRRNYDYHDSRHQYNNRSQKKYEDDRDRDHDKQNDSDAEEDHKVNHEQFGEEVMIGENTRHFEEDNLPISIDDFEQMDFLSNDLFKGICDYGFKYPSPIQSKTIHIINKGHDLIAQSQSGSGKTGAFVIGAISRINLKHDYPQVLILANTRLLAVQIEKVTSNITKFMGINICLCVGGYKNNSFVNAQEAKNAHVLIGTPGRVCDMLEKKAFYGRNIMTLIMDESDVLLKEEFKGQVADIISHMGKETQICIFSATFTKDTLLLTEKFLRNPYRITVEKEKVSVQNVKQYRIDLRYEEYKFSTLNDLFSKLTFNQMIIFTKSIRSAEGLRDRLMDNKIQAGLIHGKMHSVDRESILREFRLNYIKVLISTDVMCRGIDIDNLNIVINYDVPEDPETYIHRVGRSGRFGGQGIAINFCTYHDEFKITALNREYNTNIVSMPDIDEINELITGFKPVENKVKSSKLYMN